jgi:hypothetical protein
MIRPALVTLTIALAWALGCGGRESAGSGSDSGGGTGGILDAEIPDAFPATCTEYTFSLDPDAAADTCAFTPADVACNSNADCTTSVKVGCGCLDPVYGVNTTSTARCVAPPCGVSLNADGGIYTCPADRSGLYTQDCQFVPDSLSVAVACVNNECITFAAAPGSE